MEKQQKIRAKYKSRNKAQKNTRQELSFDNDCLAEIAVTKLIV